ncbi:hypothetical protein [Zooshikella sp. RANM57]|uniref:hypothetical protein n=1 Tax=Zooshikella sp. RANM57 TaxID=3425863 RepID=UPI003D6EC1D2
MNKTFNPRDESTLKLLNELNTDKRYILMCKNQNCFRARISPKPWRIGVDRLRSTPGVWPVKKQHMETRIKWVKEYEKKAKQYASCHFLMQLGNNDIDPKAEAVRAIHDKHSKAAIDNLILA